MNFNAKTDQNALMIFVKYPEPGKVKTRLYPEISLSKAAELYKAMVDDIITTHSDNIDYEIIICYAPAERIDDFNVWLGDRYTLKAQRGPNLGDRLINAFSQVFSDGFNKAIVIGSDCPQISRTEIEAAFDALNNRDIVIGPTEDGGYYLIGMSKLHEAAFRNISWSSDKVLGETLEILSKKRLSVDRLNSKFDIDTYRDVVRLREYLENGKPEVSTQNTLKTLGLDMSQLEE
ncbi:MAG: glycosyltransferase [candidate division Zixibacteria bacterium]|nr:glycosyltransferase [candidate division Zixibacteria bacterium]